MDENLTAKVADFGLSKLVSDSAKGHVSTQVKGTLVGSTVAFLFMSIMTVKHQVESFHSHKDDTTYKWNKLSPNSLQNIFFLLFALFFSIIFSRIAKSMISLE